MINKELLLISGTAKHGPTLTVENRSMVEAYMITNSGLELIVFADTIKTEPMFDFTDGFVRIDTENSRIGVMKNMHQINYGKYAVIDASTNAYIEILHRPFG